MLMNVQRVGSLRRNEPRKKSVVECSEPRTSICVSYLIKDMFFFEHCMIDCFPLNVVAVSDRFMNTLDTPRRVILRVFHERDINWAARDRGDVVVYADGSINSRKLLPKGSKQTAGMMTRTHVAWPPIWFIHIYEIGSIRLSHPHCSPCPMPHAISPSPFGLTPIKSDFLSPWTLFVSGHNWMRSSIPWEGTEPLLN